MKNRHEIGEPESGDQLILEAYDDLDGDRYIWVNQVMADQSIALPYDRIDDVIQALTELKKGFDEGWDCVE